ncbi:MAG TPA: hypothetical protein ENK96_02000 [Desulfobulbaceae bacterium]|nr:hypothetical protein [Desulfobulbaceae bacterium]
MLLNCPRERWFHGRLFVGVGRHRRYPVQRRDKSLDFINSTYQCTLPSGEQQLKNAGREKGGYFLSVW